MSVTQVQVRVPRGCGRGSLCSGWRPVVSGGRGPDTQPTLLDRNLGVNPWDGDPEDVSKTASKGELASFLHRVDGFSGFVRAWCLVRHQPKQKRDRKRIS